MIDFGVSSGFCILCHFTCAHAHERRLTVRCATLLSVVSGAYTANYLFLVENRTFRCPNMYAFAESCDLRSRVTTYVVAIFLLSDGPPSRPLACYVRVRSSRILCDCVFR